MAKTLIKEVIEREHSVLVYPESGSYTSHSLRDAYMAGYNDEVIVMVENASSGGTPRIYDANGRKLGEIQLNMKSSKILSIGSTAITCKDGYGETRKFDFNGKQIR